jgi:hypothetical protein
MKNFLYTGSKLLLWSAIASIALVMSVSYAFSGTGNGTEGNPYQITSCDEFMEINDNLWAHYVLMDDIDCSSDGNDIMIGSGSSFTWSFNGSWNSITIDINSADTNLVALFKTVWIGGLIEKTHVIWSVVWAKFEVAGLAGMLNWGTISESSATVTITLTSPLAPDNYYLSVWGLVGISVNALITNSSVNVTINSPDGTWVGGMVWVSYWNTTFSGCVASGTIFGDNSVGGLIGFANDDLTIINSYSMVNVSWNSHVGWFAGYSEEGTTTIENSFVAGLINGDDTVWWIIGVWYDSAFSILWTFRDILGETNPTEDGSEDTVWLDTPAMQDIQTYLDAGWDISPWGTDMNNGYPFLAREVGGSNSTWYIYTDDILGCMDEDADNYDEDATVDNDSCTYTILGCMDEDADNYDEDATVDNDSCEYTEEVVTPPSSGGGSWGGGGSYSATSLTFAQKVVANLQVKWTALSQTQKQKNVQTIIALYNQIQHKTTLDPALKKIFEEIIAELLKQYPIGNK